MPKNALEASGCWVCFFAFAGLRWICAANAPLHLELPVGRGRAADWEANPSNSDPREAESERARRLTHTHTHNGGQKHHIFFSQFRVCTYYDFDIYGRARIIISSFLLPSLPSAGGVAFARTGGALASMANKERRELFTCMSAGQKGRSVCMRFNYLFILALMTRIPRKAPRSLASEQPVRPLVVSLAMKIMERVQTWQGPRKHLHASSLCGRTIKCLNDFIIWRDQIVVYLFGTL
jgi:hypothetical protein